MVHPVQSMVERINGAGACPRLQVNLICEGVVCPDFIIEQWQEELIIDLDPSYPLNLSFEADRVDVDLAFDGHVTRCSFPYKSIYMVTNRATGQGIVLDAHMPESVRRKRQGFTGPRRGGQLQKQAKPKRTPGESRRHRRPKAQGPESESQGPAEPRPTGVAELAPAVVAEDESDKGPSRETRDEVAQRRRSVFKVIDGGK